MPIQQKLDQLYKRSDAVRVYQNTTEMQHYVALVEAGKTIGNQDENGKWSYDFKLLKDPEKNKAFREALVAFYEGKIKEQFGDAVANDEMHQFQLFALIAGVSSTQLKDIVKEQKDEYVGFHKTQVVGSHIRQISQQFTPYVHESITPGDVEEILDHLGITDKVKLGSATLDDAVAAALRKHERGEIELSWLHDREILKDEYASQLTN